MAAPALVASRADLSALIQARGAEEGVLVRVADPLLRLSDLVRLHNRLEAKVQSHNWLVVGADLAPLVPVASIFRQAVSELDSLIRAMAPNHLRFEVIEEAEKLRATAIRLILELHTLEEGGFNFVEHHPERLYEIGDGLLHLAHSVLDIASPWSGLRLNLCAAKSKVDAMDVDPGGLGSRSS